jgi:hypothetical protein
MRKQFQKAKQSNPALQQMMIEKRVKEAMKQSEQSGLEKGVILYTIILSMVLHDKSGLPEEDIKRIIKEISRAADSINGDYETIPDMIKALKEEGGYTISDEKLMEYWPELEGFLAPTE